MKQKFEKKMSQKLFFKVDLNIIIGNKFQFILFRLAHNQAKILRYREKMLTKKPKKLIIVYLHNIWVYIDKKSHIYCR